MLQFVLGAVVLFIGVLTGAAIHAVGMSTESKEDKK